MTQQLFVNLPCKDLNRTMEFFQQLGFQFNSHFTNEQAACMIIAPQVHAMLVTEPYFKTFTKKEIADARKTTEVLVALSVESREEVDEMVAKAVKAGGTIAREPKDHGFMYEHAFEDLDGHIWETFWMDPQAVR